MAVRVIDVKVGVFDENNRIADEVREGNKEKGTFMVNIMASPGAGKTTTLLRTIDMLRDEFRWKGIREKCGFHIFFCADILP